MEIIKTPIWEPLLKADKPIVTIEDDLFGRSSFAKTLADEIKALPSNESIVIGLSGPWGSGKTSLINLVSSQLFHGQEDKSVTPGSVIVVRFNPWNQIDNVEQSDSFVISSFFDSIRNRLFDISSSRYIQKSDISSLADALLEYANILNGGLIGRSAKALSLMRKKRLSRKRGTIEGAKKEVLDSMQFLREYDIKLLVVIDDIDRLSSGKIRLIFQMITAVADFQSINYLVAYDHEIVCAALEQIQMISGERYLEKVIQVPLNLPEPSSTAIRTEVIKRFEFVANSVAWKREEGNNDFSIIATFVQSIITSIRAINRLDNTLRFKLRVLGEEIDNVDLFGLESLRITYPAIIEWMRHHRFALCVSGHRDDVVTDIDEKSSISLFEDFFDEFKDVIERPSDAFDVIQSLFVDVRDVCSRAKTTRADLHERRRVCDLEIFELYLNCDVSTISDMSGSLYEIMRSEDSNKLARYIKEAYVDGRYLEAIEYILQVSDKINTQSAQAILNALTSTIKFADRSGISFSENTRTTDLIEKMVVITTEENHLSFFMHVYGRMDDESVVCFAEFIIRRERAYDRNGFQGRGYDQLIPIGDVEELEKKFSEAMLSLAESSRLVQMGNLYPQMTLLRQIDRNAFDVVVGNIDECPLNLVLIAESFVGSWSGIGQSGLAHEYFTNDEITKYVDLDKIKVAGVRILGDRDFWSIPYTSRMKTATLLLSVEEDRFGALGNVFDIEEIESRLNQWRDEFNDGNDEGVDDKGRV